MGLFDKRKKGDDFDSPVEKIDLNAPIMKPAPVSKPAHVSKSAHVSERRGVPVRTAMAEAKPVQRYADPERAPEQEPTYDPPPYGIDDAIKLMRALPGDNIELVAQVVKQTLESTNVQVNTIINDASRKQTHISDRIKYLSSEIEAFEQDIATRRKEISVLEADHQETSVVKERLQLAEQLSAKASGKLSGKMSATSTKNARSNAPTSSSNRTKAAADGSKTAEAVPVHQGSVKVQPTAKGTTIVAKK